MSWKGHCKNALFALALTGLIAPQAEAIEEVDDDLTLTGLRLIYERNEHGALSKAPPPPSSPPGADA